MRLIAVVIVFLAGISAAMAQPSNNPWPGQCPAGTSASAIGCYPQAATPGNTDLLWIWQVAQAPKTRAVQVQQLLGSGLPATLSSLTVTGNATIGGTLGVTGLTSLSSLSTSGNVNIGGSLGVVGATSLSSATVSGKLTAGVSTSSGAGFNVPPGVAPTVPGNGDMWTTAAGLFVEIGSETKGPLTSSTGTVTSIATVAPLAGGTCTTSCTLSLNTSGVTPASYGGPSNIPSVTVDTYGRITTASNTPLPIVYALGHGVKCDGTTDDATAMNVLLAVPGTVVLPAGTCIFKSGLTMNTSGVALECQGWHTTTLSFNISSGDLITVGNGTTYRAGNRISNCGISSSVARTGGASIHTKGVYDSVISYIYCTGSTWQCISHDGSTDGGDFANYIDHIDTEISGCINSCLLVGGASTFSSNHPADLWVSNSYFGYGYTGIGVEVSDCGGCHFHNVNGSQANLGWVFDPGNGQQVGIFGEDMQADANVNSGFSLVPTGSGIIVSSEMTGLWSSFNGQVAGHTSSTAVGFYLHNNGAIYGLRLANCHIGYNAGYGIYADVATLNGASFSGCQIGGNSQQNVNLSSNVTITTGQHWSFVGGQIGAAGTGGPSGNPAEDSRYGIECGGSSDYIVIQAVDLTGNQTAELGPGCTSVAHFAIGNNL